MREITSISVHTSDSYWGDVNAIRAWHTLPKPKGQGWNDVGYHFIIKNGIISVPTKGMVLIEALNGAIDIGRPLNVIPSAIYGYNSNMIAICLIGKDGKYTRKQLESLVSLLLDLIDEFNLSAEDIKGHREYPDVYKTCPNLDMDRVREAVIGAMALDMNYKDKTDE